jgi:hypothetical protein
MEKLLLVLKIRLENGQILKLYNVKYCISSFDNLFYCPRLTLESLHVLTI